MHKLNNTHIGHTASVTGVGPSRLGPVVAGLAFLLLVAFSPAVYGVFWSPAAALVPLCAALGLPALVGLARGGPAATPARWALAFVGVAAASAAAAGNRTVAVFGLYNWGTGFIFVASLAGAYALGAALDARGRWLLERAVVAGLLVNAAVAVPEMLTDLSVFQLGLFDGRSPGLLGNPVFLGGLVAAGTGLLAPRFRRRPLAWAPAVALAGAAAQLSGSRIVLPVLAGTAVVGARRMPRGAAVAFALALLAGFAVGGVLGVAGGGRSVAARVAESGGAASGVVPRLEAWRAGLRAVADRPALGAGPGRFKAATSRYRTVRLVRTEGADRYATDAHAWPVEYAVTTGLAGLGALAGWLWTAGRRARGPLATFAAGLAAFHLVQPQSVRITPVALLALGAAGPVAPLRWGRARSWVAGAGVAVALAGGGSLIAGDHYQMLAYRDFRIADAETADRLLPNWPKPAILASRIHTFVGKTQRRPEEVAAAIRWRRVALARDPTDPVLWNDLADILAVEGRFAEARPAYRSALRWDPVSVRAMNGLARMAAAEGRSAEAARWWRRSLAVLPGQPAVAARLRALARAP